MLDNFGNICYGYIYKITNFINKKYYIGQSIYEDKNYYGSGIYIKRAIKKYGKQNFKKEILGYCSSQEELNDSEIECIAFFESQNIIYGYNISKGGEGSDGFKDHHHTDEAKENIRIKNSGENSWNFGRKIPKEQTERRIATYKENNKDNQYGKAQSIRLLKESEINKNRIWVFTKLKNDIYDERWVDKNELQIYLDKGFIEGRKPESKEICIENLKLSDNCKERIWISKDRKNKRIKNHDLEKFLSEGWILGINKIQLDIEIIKNLLDQKLSYTKIAKQLGISRGYLIKFVKNYDIDFYNKSLKRIHKNRTCSNFVNSKRFTGKFKYEISNELLLQIKQEYDSGLQFKQLAEKYNFPDYIINRRIKTLEVCINE